MTLSQLLLPSVFFIMVIPVSVKLSYIVVLIWFSTMGHYFDYFCMYACNFFGCNISSNLLHILNGVICLLLLSRKYFFVYSVYKSFTNIWYTNKKEHVHHVLNVCLSKVSNICLSKLLINASYDYYYNGTYLLTD